MKAILQSLFGLAFGAFCLWLALRQIDHADLGRALHSVEWNWVVVSVFLYAINLSVRIRRWQLILSVKTVLSYRQVAVALIVGYMVNNLLPARLGELYRADFTKRRYGITRSTALGSIFVERILDATAVVLALNVGLMIAFVASDLYSATFVNIALTATAVLIVMFFASFLFPRMKHQISRIPLVWLHRRMSDFIDALGAMRLRAIVAPVFLTAVIYVFEALGIYAVLRAAGVDVGLAGVLISMGVAVLSTLLPTAPGYVGSLQLAFILSLALFEYPASSGFAAATIVQVFLSGGVVAAGLAIQAYISLFGVIASAEKS